MSATTLRTTAILKTDLAGSTPRFRELREADLAALLREHRALIGIYHLRNEERLP